MFPRAKMAKTERLKKSAIVNMQKQLNKELSEKRDILKNISNYMAVNLYARIVCNRGPSH